MMNNANGPLEGETPLVKPDDASWAVKDSRGVSRRTIVQGAAWSVPVIAVAVATPLAAASVDPLCTDQTTDLTANSVAWNDGANGGNLIGVHNGAQVYGPNTPLFTDLTMQNTGQTVVTKIQAATSLEMGAHDSSAVPPTGAASLILSDGTVLEPIATYPVYDQANLRWVFTYDFGGFALAPGQTAVFRTAYNTTSAAGANYVQANPYQVAIATQILCNGASIDASENGPGGNGLQTPNPYYVLS